ncbi:grasp-with-spasm system A modified peptide [Chryseobacterium sp. JV558]|nr:grasp-with-spasm system A modified peptide [Chryseobacterium sp. JV558]
MTQMIYTTQQKMINMKKLIGMKSNYSSLENKKMKNLQSIKGGDTAINYVSTNKGEVYDKETWVDHKLSSTLEVG